jgi:hypothetical protein
VQIVIVDLSLIVLEACGRCCKPALVNKSIFPDFCTRPYTDSAIPPCAHARPRYSHAHLGAALQHAMRHAGESKILNAFNSKKRFFNEFNDLEDLEY